MITELNTSSVPFLPDDHSKLEPPLPFPNRTVKQLRANDSADPRVKVGHRQAITKNPLQLHTLQGVSLFTIEFL